ncbi:hypothetical protein FBUS_00758 [Fasciolopsis buskii]|uniref:Glyoxalase/fosfomycin resistance/dioxygenase domain-containing protein n=1 Tax=Fasciolopsis buskii TaxID=27845 RepID=A0A8E0VG51_9TREM|nr:hypothetical protein FBUS_00758 [Fasciolopsis buski]
MFRYFQNIVKPAVRFAGSSTWKVSGLNHVAIVVPNIEAASAFYRDTFGVKVDKPMVNNLGEAIRGIKAKNLRFLAPEPKIGACGVPIIFMNPKDASGVLTELEETHSQEGH